MKGIFLGFTLLLASAMAEPPRYRFNSQAQNQNQQGRQYYFARQQQDAPYPASGWRPEGPSFDLPERQLQQQYGAPDKYGAPAAPQNQYGAPTAPQNQYGAPTAPQNQYGAPTAPQNQYGAPAAPQRQYVGPAAPQQQYGGPAAPQQQYGAPSKFRASQQQFGAASAPQQQYGAAATFTTDQPNTTEFDESTTTVATTESDAEPVDSVNELEETPEEEGQQKVNGEYYVALPDGRLQRVRYASRHDLEAMKVFARIRAENVEPLRGPIYAYAPLQRLQFAPSKLEVTAGPQQGQAPEKLRIQAQAAKLSQGEQGPAQQVQYTYEAPSAVVPLPGSALSSSYTTYTANYQAPSEARYLLTF
ncbi:pro-resilin-like [Orussus abietinus]|uniref:pro-resilin-like n=1 Tax=Orussus abietinus TaxID=222816 RepID=UPI000C715ECE|nr:pro-resilin-like [Orussus abietinus]